MHKSYEICIFADEFIVKQNWFAKNIGCIVILNECEGSRVHPRDASEMLHYVTNDEFTICHNRMDFPQEIGTQHDK